jgi:hypothetical protein
MILLHPDHTRKCFKVEYLSQIEYDFQKSCVTSPWDHNISVYAKKEKNHACVLLCHLPIYAWTV